MSSDDFTINDEELTIENMVEFGNMYFKAVTAMHKKTGDGRLANTKLKIVETVTSVDPQAGLALRAQLTANVVTQNAGGGQFNTTPPAPISGGAQASIPQNPVGPVDAGSFLETGQGEAVNPNQAVKGDTGEAAASTGAELDPPANQRPTPNESDESREEFFLNNSPTNIAAKYDQNQLLAIATGLGLTVEPSHRPQQVAAIIKTHLKEAAKK